MGKSLEDLMDRWERFQKTQSSPEEQAKQKREELTRQTAKFWDALYYVTLRQFGAKYVNVHTRDLVTSIEQIEENIQTLLQSGMGGFYSSDPGAGKTHILLEIFNQICLLSWQEFIKTHDYPDASSFIERTCRYVYVGTMYILLENRERIPLSQYNLIDDLGLGQPTGYVMTGMECYFEEINRRGLHLVVTSNLSKKDILAKKGYGPIGSRLCEKCNFYELGSGDRRKVMGALV